MNEEKRLKDNAQSKAWREANKEAFKEMQKDWMLANPTYYFLNNARSRAKKSDLPYSLNIKYLRTLTVPDTCPYLGIPIYKGKGSSSENSPSLDRIIPELGYIPGNVEFVSSRANRLKNDATWQELLAIAERLRNLTG